MPFVPFATWIWKKTTKKCGFVCNLNYFTYICGDITPNLQLKQWDYICNPKQSRYEKGLIYRDSMHGVMLLLGCSYDRNIRANAHCQWAVVFFRLYHLSSQLDSISVAGGNAGCVPNSWRSAENSLLPVACMKCRCIVIINLMNSWALSRMSP